MSMEAIQAVFDSDLADAAWQVAIAIADRINGSGEAWPSVDDIAKRTRLSRRTVLRSIPKVDRSGLFAVERQNGHANIYRFNPCQNVTRAKMSPVTFSPSTGDILSKGGDILCPDPCQNVTQTHSNPIEPTQNPIAREPDAEIAESHRVPESPSVATAQPAQEPAAVAPQSSLYANTTNLPAKGGKSRKTANPAVSGDATHCAKAFAVLRQIKAGSERAASASTVAKFAAAVFEPLLADYSRDEVLLVLDWLHEDPADKWRYGCANLPAGYTHAFRRQFPTFLEMAKRWGAVR